MSLSRLNPAYSIQFGSIWLYLAFIGSVASVVNGEEREASRPKIDYQRDVRPILSNYCFSCHGFDDASRQADLRLDNAESAFAQLGDHAAIVPGKPEESELVKRIFSDDLELQMPPPTGNKVMSAEQKEVLRSWIAEGAEYKKHWAFEPLSSVTAPVDTDASSIASNEIDSFIKKQLQERQLRPAQPADRYTLIRRLYHDLLGILPEPAEVDRFVTDPSPDAYAQLVERLLASPRFGERWGRHWLDHARYADSNGFTIDGPRVMWPYRDWVIQAINKDMPFDQFTIEQLAGDLLPSPTKSQLVASAFHRNTMINEEGGVKPDQYRHEAVIDRVNTTGAVWLGLTIGCAQCHTHKYDPVSIDDYYRMYAFFNACADANSTNPMIEVVEGEMFGVSDKVLVDIEELKLLKKEQAKLEKKIKDANEAKKPELEWKAASVNEAKLLSGMELQNLEDGSWRAPTNAGGNEAYRLVLSVSKGTRAIRLRTLTDPTLPQMGPGKASNGNFVLTEFVAGSAGKSLKFSRAWADHSQPKYAVSGAIDGDAKTGWAINTDAEQVKKQPALKMNAPHEAIFILAEPIDKDDAFVEITLKHDLNKDYLIGRFAIDVSSTVPVAETTDASGELEQVKQQIAQLQARLPGGGAIVSQMVSRDLPQRPATYRLTRGEFLKPDKDHGELTPSVPAVFVKDTKSEMGSRLDLAKWLVSGDNPLTPRVYVNRVWMHLFGTGIVETENDFGMQGASPSHPELLDWLATEMIRSGWSTKSLIRQIVNSETYQQSSQWRREVGSVDAANRLLARQTRLRTEAEIVRDMALSASGALVNRIGGPSVHPPQPEGIYSFTQNVKNWPDEKGEGRYRRTLYTEFYRSAPYPLFTTFDAPDFSTVCTRRSRSNTPLQALTVANDKVFWELSQLLATRVLREPITSSDQVNRDRLKFLFRIALCRPPTEGELSTLENHLQSMQKRLSQPDAAKQLEEISAEKSSDAEYAAWVLTARVILNTDEFVNRD